MLLVCVWLRVDETQILEDIVCYVFQGGSVSEGQGHIQRHIREQLNQMRKKKSLFGPFLNSSEGYQRI